MDLDGITLDALRAFTVFAEHRNFTRAAEELHLSQPALHVKINKLGSALGVRLYERDGRTLHVTAEGREVARYAGGLDADLRTFVAGLGPAAPTAPVTIAAGEGAHLHVLAGGIRRLLADETEIRLLTTNTDETLAALREHRADLGVAVVQARPKGLLVRRLASYPQVLVLPAGHPRARARALRLRDLDGSTLVVPPPGRPHRVALDRALRRAGTSTTVGIEVEGWTQMLHFVSLGVGLAVVNGCVAPPEGLVARPITDLPAVTYVGLRRREDERDARIGAVLDVLEASVP